MTKLVSVCAVAALITSFVAAASKAGITVEFSEADPGNLTLLDGTAYFDAYGLAFEDTTYYAVDNRFIGAGTDDRGITTTDGPDNLMTIVFTKPATYVRVDWIAADSSDIYTTVYDSDGSVLAGSFSAGAGTLYGGDAYQVFSGPLISKLTFHDGTGWIGVGRIAFEPVPTPGAILLGGIGVGLVGWLRRRRTL